MPRSFPVIAALVVVLVLGGRSSPVAQQPDRTKGASLLLTNAWLVDGTGSEASPNTWVKIEGDRIAAVGQGTPPPAAGARVLDLAGKTILPGLADMHVHLGPLPRAKWVLKLLLAHGVTTVKETGNTLGDLEAIAGWQATDATLPRVHVSGVTLNGSFPDRRFLPAGRQTRALLDDNLRFGVEFIKIHNWISSSAFKQIAETARQHDLFLTGHVPLSMTSVGAIDGGMTILEHVRLHAVRGDGRHAGSRTHAGRSQYDGPHALLGPRRCEVARLVSDARRVGGAAGTLLRHANARDAGIHRPGLSGPVSSKRGSPAGESRPARPMAAKPDELG